MSETPEPSAVLQTPCDLVMRGGVTSGLVYPKAVIQLKEKYWFRGIAGSSVGVVAAAATAAAEHGRGQAGFRKLDQLSNALARRGRLLELFQPTPATAPAMSLFLRLLSAEGGFVWAAARALGLYWRFGVIVLMVLGLFAVGAGLAAAAGASGWWLVRFALVAVGVAVLVGVALVPWSIERQLGRLADAVRANDLGVCTGMNGVGGRPDRPALTEYLHATLADLAGLPPGSVLTFGDLARNRFDDRPRPIELKMVTTDLSTQMPVVFPLPRQTVFLFSEAEFRNLFPKAVVDHMVGHARRDGPPVPPGYYYLPAAADLPVLVPTRMSLAHPVLFSGVPLYTLSADLQAETAVRAEDLQRHLFSDGGIVSNFPIHIFDKWLPDGPTFGINLGEVSEPGPGASEPPSADDVSAASLTWQSGVGPPPTAAETDRVRLGLAGQEPPLPWKGVASWGDLAAAVFYAAKNHRDNAQSVLPSYRERVVTILLASSEGGLNLNMDEVTVEKLMLYGTEAGRALRDKFDFPAHRWTRLRIVLARLEEQLREIHRSLAPDGVYRGMLANGLESNRELFQMDDEQRKTAHAFLTGFWEHLDKHFSRHPVGPLNVSPPERAPALRFVPAEQEGQASPSAGG